MKSAVILPLVLAGLMGGHPPGIRAGGITNLWLTELSPYGSDSAPAIAADGTIYQGTFEGGLFAIGPEGEVKWRFKAGLEIKSSPAVAEDGTVYFGSRDRHFYAVTPQGKLKWKFATGGWVDSSPAIAEDGTVYFGSWDANFYALNPDGGLRWKYATGGIVFSSPAVAADGTIYFGGHDKFFYAMRPEGTLKWQFATRGAIISSPAIGPEGTVYFSSTDGNLYALNPDGTERWRRHTGGATQSSPVLDENGTLYLSVNTNRTAVSREGKLLWQQIGERPVGISPVATAGGQVYFALAYGWLGATDHQGIWPLLWTCGLRGYLGASPNVDGNGVIYAVDGNSLQAFKPLTNAAPPANSSWPVWRANQQHTGRVKSSPQGEAGHPSR